jgi:hypothetical protein
MAYFKHTKWTKLVLILLSIQMLNVSIMLPYMVSYISSYTVQSLKKEGILTHVFEDIFDLENQSSNVQKDIPIESDNLNIEKDTEAIALLHHKKEGLFKNNSGIRYILFDKSAASLHKPELNTPPPKLA